MPHIIRDGIRRWWWVYALAAAASVFSVLDHNPQATQLALTAGVLLYGCGMLFVFDISTPAKFRALGMLPLTQRQIGLAHGVLWIGLLPAFHFAVYMVGNLVHAVAPGLAPEGLPLPVYVAAMLFCTGMSCFFFLIAQFSRRYQRVWTKPFVDVGSTLLLFSLFALVGYFIYRLGLPANPEPLAPEHPFAAMVNGVERVIGPKRSLMDIPTLAALGIAAAGITVFVARVEDVARFLFFAGAARRDGYPLTVFSGKSNRTYGFCEPWVQEIRDGVRIIGVLAFSCAAFYLFNWVFVKRPSLSDLGIAQWPLILILIAGLVCVPPMIPWIIGIRTLRVLPISRRLLAGYLISFPLLAFSAYSLVLSTVCAHFRGVNYALNMEWWMVFVFGLSLLSVGLLLQSRHTITAAISLFLPTILTVILAYKNDHPVETLQQTALWIKAGAATALVATGYLLLYAVIARSGPYRPKPWIGGIGGA